MSALARWLLRLQVLYGLSGSEQGITSRSLTSQAAGLGSAVRTVTPLMRVVQCGRLVQLDRQRWNGHGHKHNSVGGAGAGFSANFFEILSPPGAVASYHDSGAVADATCTVCAGVALNVTATDLSRQKTAKECLPA